MLIPILETFLAFFLSWKFDPTYEMSNNETSRGGTSFKLVKDVGKSINKKETT